MSRQRDRYWVGAVVHARAQATVDYAARLRGLSRSEYIREVVLSAAEADVRADVSDRTCDADDDAR